MMIYKENDPVTEAAGVFNLLLRLSEKPMLAPLWVSLESPSAHPRVGLRPSGQPRNFALSMAREYRSQVTLSALSDWFHPPMIRAAVYQADRILVV